MRSATTLGISVNVSARQLDGDDLIDDVRAALEHSNLTPTALTLEVTETTLMRDAQASAERLRALRRSGSASRSTTSAPGTARLPISAASR